MTPGPHVERHFLGSEVVADIVIGMADGLTVPFALAAGLSAAVSSTRVVLTAGIAEICAGAIAMGLGGYLAARSRRDHYASERRREEREVVELPDREREEVRSILSEYGIEDPTLKEAANAISANPQRWVDFMMRFELGLEAPDPRRGPISAATIALAYAIGGLVPLAPYLLTPTIAQALPMSAVTTGIALAVFGAAKARAEGAPMARSAIQTLAVGACAAGAAFGLVRLLG